MTLQTAKNRRLEALKKCHEDRILVKPAHHHTAVVLPERHSIAGYLLDCLWYGCDLAQLEAETGWSKSTVLVNLYRVAKKSGVGIRRRSDTLTLLLPEGARHMFPRPKIVASESTSRRRGDFTVMSPPVA